MFVTDLNEHDDEGLADYGPQESRPPDNDEIIRGMGFPSIASGASERRPSNDDEFVVVRHRESDPTLGDTSSDDEMMIDQHAQQTTASSSSLGGNCVMQGESVAVQHSVGTDTQRSIVGARNSARVNHNRADDDYHNPAHVTNTVESAHAIHNPAHADQRAYNSAHADGLADHTGDSADEGASADSLSDHSDSEGDEYEENNWSTTTHDVVGLIPGLYRLLDLRKDDGSNGRVDKIVISQASLKKFCNDMVPNSCKSIPKIKFDMLNSHQIGLVGCYGTRLMIARLLLSLDVIDQSTYEKLTVEEQASMRGFIRPPLTPGIYLLCISKTLGLVIHWPEEHCYKEGAPDYKKKNLTNLHRYLTKLTDHQICLMSEDDLKCFAFEQADEVSDDDNEDYCVDFEVQENQHEKQDFIFGEGGFEIHLDDLEGSTGNTVEDKEQLFMVDSASHQSIVTHRLLQSGVQPIDSVLRPKELESILRQGCALKLDQKLSSKDMEQVVKCSKMYINMPLPSEQTEIENIRGVDRRHLYNYAYKLCKQTYSKLEELLTSSGIQEGILADDGENQDEYLQKNYPTMNERMTQVLRINTTGWHNLKLQVIFACTFADMVVSTGKTKSSKAEVIQDIMFRKSRTFSDLVKQILNDYKETSAYGISYLWHKVSTVTRIGREKDWDPAEWIQQTLNHDSLKKDDNTFIQELLNNQDIANNTITGDLVMSAFCDEYKAWRTQLAKNLRPVIKSLLQSQYYRFKTYAEKHIESTKRSILKKKLEERFSTGLKVTVGQVTQNSKFKVKMEKEQPAKVQLTIYETSLREDAVLGLDTEESCAQNPEPCKRTVITLNPYIYKYRQIFQFEDGTFLLVLQNNETQPASLDIYTGKAEHLERNVPRRSMTYHFNDAENVLISMNDPADLLGAYNKHSGELKIFAFDKNHKEMRTLYGNLQPFSQQELNRDVAHFVFIKNTKALCFVHSNQEAYMYGLDDDYLRRLPQFPGSTFCVQSAPNGSCLVAFAKRQPTNEQQYTSEESISDEMIIDDPVYDHDSLCAYVYYCDGISTDFGKVLDLPSMFQNSNTLQFTCFTKLQKAHLMEIDQQNRHWKSKVVKITQNKVQYQFQRQQQTTTRGQIKLDDNNPHLMHGDKTIFLHNIRPGDHLIWNDLRLSVSKVLSNTELYISDELAFQHLLYSWSKFTVEPRISTNSLLDVYSMVFTKYPIAPCIGEDNRPPSVTIAFDISDDTALEEYKENFADYFKQQFKELKTKTKKDITLLHQFKVSAVPLQNICDKSFAHVQKIVSTKQLGSWIIQLCILIPIHVAVTRDNQFIPLLGGMQSIENTKVEEATDLFQIVKAISFGWYDGIFQYYANKKVKVVSSMGEQSCGKSYLLNHLVGTNFDGSAMRCTEGVWMSLAIVDDMLYVALDFEGLNSMERTPQEDLLLTLFNASISTMILYKNQFAISRDVASMFQRFQDKSKYFGTEEEEEKTFQALFCIIIKDVPKNDRDGILQEFNAKFGQIVAKEGKNNFISRLYKKRMTICPWPLFNDKAFYSGFQTLKTKLDKKTVDKYKNAQDFVQQMKIVMGKLKMCLWGSLDESLYRFRIAEILNLLKAAIACGQEVENERTYEVNADDQNTLIDTPNVKCLMNHHSDTPIADNSEMPGEHEGAVPPLPDTGLVLYNDSKKFYEIVAPLQAFFENNYIKRVAAVSDDEWLEVFSKFTEWIADRRIARVQQWFDQNTDSIPNDYKELDKAKQTLSDEIKQLKKFWTQCLHKCEECYLNCLNSRDHEGKHDCLTDHQCQLPCSHEDAHVGQVPPVCEYKAGHEGKHFCSANHMCRRNCQYLGRPNCQKLCAKSVGHKGDHLCQATKHYCGEACSQSTCNNKCTQLADLGDHKHICQSTVCPVICAVPNCNKTCKVNDHFHGLFVDGPTVHLCGNEHSCSAECELPGICSLDHKSETAEYENAYGKFQYRKTIQKGEKLACKIKIPKDKVCHEGKHSHGDNFHYCNQKCPYCEYYCNQPYGHNQLHDTAHGNMMPTRWTYQEDNTFEFDGHKHNVGDPGISVMCNLLCKDAGRHSHVEYCAHDNEQECKDRSASDCLKLGRQHIDTPLAPNPTKPKDYVTHKQYWNRAKFKDPYSECDQIEFGKCDHQCADPEHKKDTDTVDEVETFCKLELFHVPLDLQNQPAAGKGYISIDGHSFSCENPVKTLPKFHVVFAIDQSGSMSYGVSSNPSKTRLQAVCGAVTQFMNTRTAGSLARTGPFATCLDSYSLVLFNHTASSVFENCTIDVAKSNIQNIQQQWSPAGGTRFDESVKEAHKIIERHFDASRINVMLFLSDGISNVPTTELRNLCEMCKQKNSPLYLNTILFSTASASSVLNEMVNIASEYVPPSSTLKCRSAVKLDDSALTDHFVNIAKSLRMYKPTLLK